MPLEVSRHTSPPPLDISYEWQADILMIDGVRYSGDLFRLLGFGPTGRPLLVTRKEDGLVTFLTFDLTEAGIAAAREEVAHFADMVCARADALTPAEVQR
jgi:hypothetical protein